MEVVRTTTLDAARTLFERGRKPAALNFANATVPGGGFLGGALAQEESLCRASGLYACLLGNPMYAYHAARDDHLYTDTVIYSPDVPVFRGEDGRLLDSPWPCAFLTAAAPFASLHVPRNPGGVLDLEPAFRSRITRVLAVAANQEHDAVVLGAWGCGEFGNDPVMVSRVFDEVLGGPFAGVFAEVVFAITDSTQQGIRLTPFQARFGGGEDRVEKPVEEPVERPAE